MFDLLQMEAFLVGHSAVPNYDGDKELDATVPKGKWLTALGTLPVSITQRFCLCIDTDPEVVLSYCEFCKCLPQEAACPNLKSKL